MGWYSKEAVKVLLVMCRKYESGNIFRIARALSTTTLSSPRPMLNGVYGEGFDAVKMRIKSTRSGMAKEILPPTQSPALSLKLRDRRYNFGKCEKKCEEGHSIPNFSYLCSLQNSERLSSAVSACVPDFKPNEYSDVAEQI